MPASASITSAFSLGLHFSVMLWTLNIWTLHCYQLSIYGNTPRDMDWKVHLVHFTASSIHHSLLVTAGWYGFFWLVNTAALWAELWEGKVSNVCWQIHHSVTAPACWLSSIHDAPVSSRTCHSAMCAYSSAVMQQAMCSKDAEKQRGHKWLLGKKMLLLAANHSWSNRNESSGVSLHAETTSPQLNALYQHQMHH